MTLGTMENRHAVGAFRALFRNLDERGRRVARIIELGGGLSALLNTYCVGADAEFVIYARAPGVAENAGLRELGVAIRVKDVAHPFTMSEIAREIQKPGLTILVCDGLDTAATAKTFAGYLKPGDIVIARDEITGDDGAEITRAYELEPLLAPAFIPAAWMCRVKRGAEMTLAPGRLEGDDTVALYVVSGNAPDRFRTWIDAARRADPTMLAATDRVLLNTSTDASCWGAYETLCAEHGFEQLDVADVGSEEGRRRCLRHFCEATDHGTMVCFDDGMRVHSEPGLCPHGFSRFMPRLLSRSLEILRNEPALDCLTLSFGGFHATEAGTIKSHAGVSYIVGGVAPTSTPALLTRRAARRLLHGHGRLNGGVLLASPVNGVP